jgi:hypothetical protein
MTHFCTFYEIIKNDWDADERRFSGFNQGKNFFCLYRRQAASLEANRISVIPEFGQAGTK